MGPWGVEPKSETIGALFVFSLTPPCSLWALMERTAGVQGRRGKCPDPAVDLDWSHVKNLQTTTLAPHATRLPLETGEQAKVKVGGLNRWGLNSVSIAVGFDIVCDGAAVQTHYEGYFFLSLLNLEEAKRLATLAVWCPSSATCAKQFENNKTLWCCLFPPDSEIISPTVIHYFYVPLETFE